MPKRICLPLLTLLAGLASAQAWDYENHRLVNQLALASLPTNFPAFVTKPEARERIAFLSGEPDRWRNTSETTLKHYNNPDHFIDLEYLELYRLQPEALDPLRYEFVGRLAALRATNTVVFPDYDAAKDTDKTKLLVGLLPWAITEYQAKLQSGFSYLKAYEEGGTPEEIANAHQNLVYIMGVMGHYVGDASQPLHTTKHYNGWVGENPQGYSTNRTIHSWIDGGYLGRVGVKLEELQGKLRPAKLLWAEGSGPKDKPVFAVVLEYIREQHKLVEPLYQHDKEGRLSARGTKGLEGKEFLAKQLVVAGQMLGDLWFTAGQKAPADGFLKSSLARRKREGNEP